MHSTVRIRRLALPTVAACFATAGAAQAACPTAAVSQPFKQFGDNAYYTLAPGTKVSLAGMLAHGAKENYSDWKPSNILKLTTALPISSLGGTAIVQIRVSADGGGDWQIDDVFLDPRLYK